jgi:TPR repeat protein
MSYDLYLWKWRDHHHVSEGACYLLMVEGRECEDAALLDTDKLKREMRRALKTATGQVECEVMPRGVVLEAHGTDPAALLECVAPVARRHGLVIFDPQEDQVSDEDRSSAEALAEKLKGEDEQARLQAEMPGLVARAAAGDPQALVELGNHHFFGETVARDVAEAFRCYLRAAEAGSDAGMVNVASCYRRGEGVTKNLDLAMKWYERAMKTDPTFAPFELGVMYQNGEGMAKDREKAVHLFSVALENDHPDARAALRRLGALPPVPKALVRP